jgi:hypothetical protein
MAKRIDRGEPAAEDLRRLLVAAVVEYGNRKLVPSYALALPRRALKAAGADGGTLATLELPGDGLLLTHEPARPETKAKR